MVAGNECLLWKNQSQVRFPGTRALGISVKVETKLKSHSLGCGCLQKASVTLATSHTSPRQRLGVGGSKDVS